MGMPRLFTDRKPGTGTVGRQRGTKWQARLPQFKGQPRPMTKVFESKREAEKWLAQQLETLNVSH